MEGESLPLGSTLAVFAYPFYQQVFFANLLNYAKHPNQKMEFLCQKKQTIG